MASLPETILQFGAGRFLRAFFDRFVQHANDGGQGVGRIVVVQSTPGPRADLLNEQPDGYNVLVRGYENGALIERVEPVRSISRALLASTQWPQVLEFARSPNLRMIVSNATEAGYALDPNDRADSNPPQAMPAKLTQVLWARHQAGGAPLTVLPCELFERNATKLLELVIGLSQKWSLPEEFQSWVREKCLWLNNLVDCIITSPPPEHPLNQRDKLLVCAEPFALLAVEKPRNDASSLFVDPAIKIVDELAPYYLRKVRILNGIHTVMVGKFLQAGFKTVQEILKDRAATRWIRAVLFEEIVPTLAYRVEDTAEFADETFDRFRNPYLSHKLSDIALHHADKIRIRLQPTREEYETLFGKPPKKLAEAMAYRPATS